MDDVYFQDGCTEIYANIDVLFDAAQFNSVVDGVTVYDVVLIIFCATVVPQSSIHGFISAPLGIVRWNYAENRLQRFDSEVNCMY